MRAVASFRLLRSSVRGWDRDEGARCGVAYRWLAVIGFSVAALLTLVGCAAPSPRTTLAYFPPPPARARVVHLVSFNSLNQLVARKPSFVEAVRGGVVSPFASVPAGIAYRSGVLYVCDTGQRVVHRWNLETGQALPSLGVAGSTMEKPVAVTVDDNATAYVADAQGGVVLAFDQAGALARRYQVPDGKRQVPVAVAQVADHLFVADIASHRVHLFSVSTGRLLQSLGGIGSQPGTFYYPMGVAVTRTGELIVSDMMNSRVQVFDHTLKPRLQIGQPGNRYGDLGKPRHIAVGPDGVLFVTDVEFQRVHLFDETGRLLMLLGGQGERTDMPVGVAVAPALPDSVARLVPNDFEAKYFLFVTNTIGPQRISLYAVGLSRSPK